MKKLFFSSYFYLLGVMTGLLLCSGCYRMPEDGEVSVIPVTNNPSMTRHQASCMPGVEY